METKTILLADDNAEDIELTIAALDEYHLSNAVIVARDGVETLDYLFRRGAFAGRQNGDPILVLLDLKMPKLDGLEVLRQVKSDPKLKIIPIVVLSSSREEQDIVKGYHLGANAYVVKPVEFDKFMALVKHLGLFWALINEPPPMRAL